MLVGASRSGLLKLQHPVLLLVDCLKIKKNEIMPFAAMWMDPEIITLSEVSQKEKDKYHMISLICGI